MKMFGGTRNLHNSTKSDIERQFKELYTLQAVGIKLKCKPKSMLSTIKNIYIHLHSL